MAPCEPGALYQGLQGLHRRDTTKEFMAAMPSVYERILSCFALGLGYPEDFFKQVRPCSLSP
jgi:isopenicillin N synthase-like dioxygenase